MNNEYVRQTIDLVRSIETRFLELGKRLFTIKDKKLWADTYDSYHEFLEAAHINPGLASMLASIHNHYVIQGAVPEERLASIGYTNLYDAIPLIERDGLETAVVKAQTLSRSEIKDEVRERIHGEHEHLLGLERWAVCQACGKFIKIDEKETNQS